VVNTERLPDVLAAQLIVEVVQHEAAKAPLTRF